MVTVKSKKPQKPEALYATKKLKIGKTPRLDELALEAGTIYSKVLIEFWRIVRHSQHWLSKYKMPKMQLGYEMSSGKLHSQTIQGLSEMFYEALDGWRELRKKDKSARPPYKRKQYQAIPFKQSAINLKNDVLRLSCGKGNEPLYIPWKWDIPKFCEISFNGKEYVLCASYIIENYERPENVDLNNIAGIDLGEIHPAVVATNKQVIIANGRELRAKRRYQNKVKAHFQRKMASKKKGSRKWRGLCSAKNRVFSGIDNQ